MIKRIIFLLFVFCALSRICFAQETQDIQKIRESAEKGDPQSQCDLGLKYVNGEDISKDEREAVKWFRKAAEQGHAKAQCLLGVMYGAGTGISRDLIYSYAWLTTSSLNGFDGAQDILNIITPQMSETQIANAKKLSLELSKKYHNKSTSSTLDSTKQSTDKLQKEKISKTDLQKELAEFERSLNQHRENFKTIVPQIENAIIDLLKAGEFKDHLSIKVNEEILLDMFDHLKLAKNVDELANMIGTYCDKDGVLFFISCLRKPRITFLNGSIITRDKLEFFTKNEMDGDTYTEDGNEEKPIFRFKGEVKFDGYTFKGEGDETERLTFTKMFPKSLRLNFDNNTFTSYAAFVYVRGRGKILFPDGKEVKLGY